MSTEKMLTLRRRLTRAHGEAIMMVTHDPKVAEYASRTLHWNEGTLAEQPYRI